MNDIEKKIENTEKDIIYFDKMVTGAEKLVSPWKTAVKWLIAALVVSNLLWATVHFYWIYKAYQEPSTYEQQQAQDFEANKQEQSNKGSTN